MNNTLKLTGCSPTPLANYLKALGILRLVSEQADHSARGAWQDESFVLSTTLSEEKLVDFFLTKYQLSPLVSPWNSGSGFLKEDNRVAPLLRKFEASSLSRLDRYQVGVRAARILCNELAAVKQEEVKIKGETNKLRTKAEKEAQRNDPEYKARLNAVKGNLKRLKEQFIPQCRLNWRGQVLEWLEAALIIQSDLSASFPSLLGTGGNDGNLDFTANFRECFSTLFDVNTGACSEQAEPLLLSALFASPSRGAGEYAIGQYAPGSAGGANSTNGLDGKANVNPWDFILFLEGTVLFASAATRRLNQSSRASAPFALYSQSAGHLSSSAGDKSSRGEQWMPLWPQPATLGEVRSLLSEGRAQLGRSATRDPLDMVRAIARLGVARGISSFERFGYLERNGQANFAVPLGRWQVTAQPRQELLADLDTFIARLHREVRSEHVSNALSSVVRALDNAILAASANGSLPLSWQNILLALADIDTFFAKIPVDKNKVGMLSSLSPGWVDAANDGSVEFRLALAFGTQSVVRRHFLPLNKFGRLDSIGSTSVVCFGRDFISDAIAFLDRRLIEAASDASHAFDQYSPFPASLADISAFIQGSLNESRLLALSRAFMALATKACQTASLPAIYSGFAEDGYALFRLCLAPRHWKIPIPPRADIFRRLASGDIAFASRAAARHLRAHGVASPIEIVAGDARRLAAALAFPLSRASHDALISQFVISQKH